MPRPTVWPFMANGGELAVEEIGFATEVIQSQRRVEQRIALKRHPVGALDAQYLLAAPWDAPWEAQRANALLYRKHAKVWAVPLWHYATEITADVAAGAMVIPAVTADSPFTDGADFGPYALLWRSSRLNELVDLQAVRQTSVELLNPTLSAWPAGTYLIPVRTARITPDFQVDWESSDKLSGNLRFVFEAFSPGPGVPTLDDAAPPPGGGSDFMVMDGQVVPATQP